MLGTYASALLVLAAAAAVGQAVFVLCGRRQWSWLAPAVGLAALMPIAWWAVRLPGEGTTALVVIGLVALAAVSYLAGVPRRIHGSGDGQPASQRARVEGIADAARTGVPVAVLALLAASLPFLAEGRFGILGTGLNPDMSQHLFAADRLAAAGSERLISEGYPLGPHSLAVALAALGPSLVQAFAGITVAAAVISALAPLRLLRSMLQWRRIAVALLVGFAYLSASYLIQGAFKETMQALFLLAFAIGLSGLRRASAAGGGLALAVPLAVLALGSAYVYSFPGLIWLLGTAGAWGALELVLAARARGITAARGIARRALRPLAVALAVLAAGIVPELTRMVDFASFETFDPDGAGLGNLFNRISPLEALGIWPSGDFRLEPGDGFAPAPLYWLGVAVAALALVFGIWWWWRRGERAVVVALAVATALALSATVAGTPYQEAKAIALASPLAMLVAARALAQAAPSWQRCVRILRRRGIANLFPRSARMARLALGVAGLAAAFGLGAAASSILALANGPVGPSGWTPALLELKPLPDATLVLAPDDYLEGEHGRDFIVWELRGGEVCVETDTGPVGRPAPPGISQVLVYGRGSQAPFTGTGAPEPAGDFTLWKVGGPTQGDSGCPFVADGDRANPSG